MSVYLFNKAEQVTITKVAVPGNCFAFGAGTVFSDLLLLFEKRIFLGSYKFYHLNSNK